MLTARIAVRAVKAPPVPRQPAPRLGIDVLAVAQVKQLVLKCKLGLEVRPAAADLTPEHHRDGHRLRVARDPGARRVY